MNIIDISHNNGIIDWNKVVEDPFNVEGVYFKTTQGIDFTDPLVKKNSALAKALGLKIGYYHFASLNNHNVLQDSYEEASYFASMLKDLYAPELPLVLDIETNKSNIPKKDVEKWVINFFAILSTKGWSDVALYSYTPFLNSNLPINHKLGNIKLWIAEYSSSLHLPNGWNKQYLWQYSDKGKIAGIATSIDLNK